MKRVGGEPRAIAGVGGVEERPLGQVDGAQKAPLEAPPLRAGSWSDLRATLAQLQVRLIDAQTYLQQGLALTRLVETRPELEEAVAKWLGGDLASLPGAIAGFAAEGPRSLAAVVETIEAQRAAFPAGHDFSALESAVSKAIFGALAAPAESDRRAAFQSSLAASKSLSIGLTRDALYPGLRMGIVGSNSFTNEPGFPKLVREAELKGGAAVGVGGAIFDLGSMGAELIVSVDANPHIKDTIHLFTAILLSVDEKATAQGWNDRQRADEVLAWLTRGPNAETSEAMEKLGLPPGLLASMDQHLGAFTQKLAGRTAEAFPIPQDLWCRGEDAPARVRHLTNLALEGRIVAVTADLADPALAARIQSLLEAHETRAQVVHLSNALDYIPDVQGVLENLGKLSQNDHAQLTTSAGSFLRNAVNVAKPDHGYLVDVLGTLQAPKVHRAKEWLGETRNAKNLGEMVWQTGPHVRQLLDWTRSAFAINEEPRSLPQNPADYRAVLSGLLDGAFGNPKWAQGRLHTVLQDSGRWDAYVEVAGGEVTPRHQLPVAKNAEELDRVADRFDAEFWAAPGHKERFLSAQLGPLANVISEGELAASRSFEDLRELMSKTIRGG